MLAPRRYFYYACIAFCLVLVPVNCWCFGRFVEVDEREIEALGYTGLPGAGDGVCLPFEAGSDGENRV